MELKIGELVQYFDEQVVAPRAAIVVAIAGYNHYDLTVFGHTGGMWTEFRIPFREDSDGSGNEHCRRV